MLDLPEVAEKLADAFKRSAGLITKSIWSPAAFAQEFIDSPNKDELRDRMFMAILVATLGGTIVLGAFAPGSYALHEETSFVEPRSILTVCLILLFSVLSHSTGLHVVSRLFRGTGNLADTALFLGLVTVGINFFTAPLLKFQELLPSPQFDWMLFLILGAALPIAARCYVCWLRGTYAFSTKKAVTTFLLAMAAVGSIWGVTFIVFLPTSRAMQRFTERLLSPVRGEVFEIDDCFDLAIPIDGHDSLQDRYIVADAYRSKHRSALRVTLAEATTCLEELKLTRRETRAVYASAKLLVEQIARSADVYERYRETSSTELLDEVAAAEEALSGSIAAYHDAFLIALDAQPSPRTSLEDEYLLYIKLSNPQFSYEPAGQSRFTLRPEDEREH